MVVGLADLGHQEPLGHHGHDEPKERHEEGGIVFGQEEVHVAGQELRAVVHDHVGDTLPGERHDLFVDELDVGDDRAETTLSHGAEFAENRGLLGLDRLLSLLLGVFLLLLFLGFLLLGFLLLGLFLLGRLGHLLGRLGGFLGRLGSSSRLLGLFLSLLLLLRRLRLGHRLVGHATVDNLALVQ